MDVFVINTLPDKSVEALTDTFSNLGNVSVVSPYRGSQIDEAFPLTHIYNDNNGKLDSTGVNVQHLTAIEKIVQRGVGGIIILDTVRVTDVRFVTTYPIPKNADMCIYTSPGVQINGIVLSGSKWVLLDSDDSIFNNVCNSYYITPSGAKKIYSMRNEILSTGKPFGEFIQSASNHLAADRIITYMSFDAVVTKPKYR